MLNRRRIIYLLVFLIALLLSLNVLLTLIMKSEPRVTEVSEMTIKSTNTIFLETLAEFGIHEDWIKRKNIRTLDSDSISFEFIVSLPIKVTIPEILRDLNSNLYAYPAEIIANEENINDNSSLAISSNGKKKLLAKFKYDRNLKRSFSKISFLLTEMENTSENEIQTIDYITYPFGSILPLEEESRNTAEYMIRKNYEYFIELTPESDKIEFELGQDLELEKLNRNVGNIISSFNSPRIFFIDGGKKEFNREMEDFLVEQLAKRERTLLDLKNFKILKGENLEDLRSLFEFHISNINPGNSEVFIVSYYDWLKLFDDIKSFTKLGNKVVSPSKLLLK